MKRRRPGLIVYAVATAWLALGLGCSDEPATAPRTRPPARLRPVVRFVLEQNRTAVGMTRATTVPVVVHDVARPVFSVADVRRADADCPLDPAAPDAPCEVELPEVEGVRWFLLEPRATREAFSARVAVQDHVGGPLPKPGYYVFGTGPDDPPALLPRHEAVAVRARPMPPVDELWVETPALKIPSDAVLRLSIAVEEGAWEVDSAPVDFVVLGLEGLFGQKKSVELFRASLDPARRPEDRHWIDQEISLAPLADKVARLRFETVPTEAGDVRPQLPLWGDPTIFAPTRQRRERPFVVLVSLDTLRARSLSALGRKIETSPFFDALAREGTLFEHAFTTYSNTLGSHMSMLTGLWPRSHGVVEGGRLLSPRKETLAERMRTAGYETAAFTEDALLSGAVGFRRGFARYSENKDVKLGGGASEETFDAALAWAESHVDVPFFLFIHTYEVHAPYAPVQPYASMFDDQPAGDRRLYEQEIRYLDDQLRRLVDQLDRLLTPERLLLVITADHGEEFYEHGRALHAQLFDEVMHVPLLFRWPGVVPEDLRVSQPVSLVDISPTILDLAGVHPGSVTDGMSLTPLFKDGGTAHRAVVFGEAPASGPMPGREFVGRTATHKCMIQEGEEEGRCFDLVRDPREKSPLRPDHDEQTSALHDEVLAYRRGAPEIEQKGTRPPSPAPHDSEEIDPKRQEKLRALGYVE